MASPDEQSDVCRRDEGLGEFSSVGALMQFAALDGSGGDVLHAGNAG